ncbi:hypothetical protein PIB30_003619 [Stylosanthes scabra]|uniref:Uncharacterized protein n=1 Tax=Stylosanthes scabra TaxID=79078 RepID=A0ABU6Y2B3_9FABA|nr:hypothetical protein [Stylosanthes scabra]
MAKNNNNVAHTIAMLIVGVIIICYVIAKFHYETSIPKGSWTTTSNSYVESDIEDCFKKCRIIFKRKAIEKKQCMMACVVEECRRRHPVMKEKFDACYYYLYDIFIKEYNNNNE